jgi:hypothetical protein
MYRQKVISKKTAVKKIVLVDTLKIPCKNNRIRIHLSEIWIRGSGSASVLKYHGSATLEHSVRNEKRCFLDMQAFIYESSDVSKIPTACMFLQIYILQVTDKGNYP